MRAKIRRFLSLLATCAMLLGMIPTTVFAANTQDVTFSATLDTQTLTVSDQDQSVKLSLKTSKAVGLDGFGYVIDVDKEKFDVTAVESTDSKITFATDDYQLDRASDSFGKVSWTSADASDIEGITDLGTVTVKVPANTPAGTYTLGFKDIKASKSGTAWEDGNTATATLTIKEASPLSTQSAFETKIKFTYGTGKLYAETDTEKSKDYLAGVSKTEEIYTVSIPAGDYIFEGYSDGTFLGSIELNVSEDSCDFTGNYGDHGQILAVTVANSDSTWVYDTDFKFENLMVMSGGQSTPTQRNVVMGENAVANRKTVLLHEGDTVMIDLVPQGTKALTYATVGSSKTCNQGYTYLAIAPVTKCNTTVTYPYADTNNDDENDFVLEFGVLKSGTYYIYDYYTPASVTDPKDGTVTATFNTAKSTAYFYKVSNPINDDAVSYGNYVKTANEEGVTAVKVTEAQMYIGDSSKTKHTVISDYSNNIYDSGDLYLACDAKGFTDRPGTGNQGVIRMDTTDNSSCTLYPYRNWLIIESISNSQVIEPDFHVSVINVEGNPITVTENTENNSSKHSFKIQANSTGTAILQVTYDAVTADQAMGNGKFFSASRPENTGILLVTVNGSGEVTSNMYSPAVEVNTTMNDPNTPKAGNAARTAGEYIDAELDHLYFLTDEGASYTFTPEEGTTVTMAKGVQNGYSGFSSSGVSVKDGEVTLSGIPEGKTIVKLVNGDKVSYQVLRATRTNLTVKDSEGNIYYDSATGTLNEEMKFTPGDKVTLIYSKLEHPAQKLSGIYNMTCTVVPYGKGISVSKGNHYGSYTFNSDSSLWKTTATIPVGTSAGTYTLSALIQEDGFGSLYGQHRELKYETGKSPNFTAVQQNAWFALPGVDLTIDQAIDMTVSFKDEDKSEIKDATITITDANKDEITQTDGVYAVYPGKTYNYVAKAAGRESVVDSFTVPTTGETYSLSIEMKKIGSTTWDGTSKTEVTPNQDGIYEIRTGAELAWFAQQVNDGTGTKWNARLMNDISLNLAAWTPIGWNSNYKYSGTFDGNGHVIRQLYVSASEGTNPLGLFGWLGSTALVKKLGVTGTVIYSGKSNTPAGGITGRMDAGAQILRCFNAANITSTKNIGGIAGFSVSSGAIIKDCYNTGAISVSSTITSTVTMIGGITGGGNSSSYCATMTNCYNAGLVPTLYYTKTSLAPTDNKEVVINCYELDSSRTTALGSNYTTNVNVCTAQQMKAAAASIGANFREDTTNVNNGFPVLRWQNTSEATAKETIASIDAIGTPITLESKTKIDAARSNYDDMSDTSGVTNYEVLTAAEKKYALFKTAFDAIDALPETMTASSTTKRSLDAATTAINALEESDRPNLTNLSTYQNALTTWDEVLKPVQISNADELIVFAARTNDDEDMLSATLTADIDMTGKTMNSIARYSRYLGTFDGNGHAITNLIVNDKTLSGVGGLFGTVGATGVVRNLTLKDSSISVRNNCGAFATTNYGHIYRCVNYASVKQLYVSSSHSVGVVVGIVGTNYSGGIVEECANYGNIEGDYRVAGIVAYNYAGGTILNCYNAGTVLAYTKNAGGISSDNYGTIKNCYNSGTVSLEGDTYTNAYPIANANTENCFYLSDSETDGVDGTTAKTDKEMRACASALGDAYMTQCGYPLFTWQTALAHDLTHNATVEATCTKAGTKENWHCERCGKYYDSREAATEISEEEVAIPAKGHSLEQKEAVAAKCEEHGNTAYWICKECGKYFSDSNGTTVTTSDKVFIPATGHSYEMDAAVAATCTKTGLTVGWHCKVCNKILHAQEETPAKGHTLTKTDAVAATCTKAGNNAYWTCGVCGKYFSDEEGNTEIEKDSWVTEAKGHTEVIDQAVPATATATGLTQGSHCSVCGEVLVAQTVTPKNDERKGFVDVPKSVWYKTSVDFASKYSIMNGKKNGTIFDPSGKITRGEFAQVLYNLEGRPEVTYNGRFSDVVEKSWYQQAVTWASENGIVTGYTYTDLFDPSGKVTREQIAVMLYRYAKAKGYDVSDSADFTGYTDAGKVSRFAEEAMHYAVGTGIITGKNDNTLLDPQGQASRAECATMMMRFCQKYNGWK